MSADVFISYASQDHRVAMTLCTALENRGFKCWISSRDIQPGENFQVAIVRAIRQVKIMLLVFTANSNNSQEMNKELALASQSKLIVVPLRIEDVTPNEAFAYEFATRQWIDFFADWEFAVQQLSDRIQNATRQAVAAEPAPEPVAAPDPVALVQTEAPPGPTAVLAPVAEKRPRKAAKAPAPPKPVVASLDDESLGEDGFETLADGSDLAPAGLAALRQRLGARGMAVAAAVAVLAVVTVAVGLVAPGMLNRKPAAPPESRVMAVVRAQPAAPPIEHASLVSPAPAAEAEPPPPPPPPTEVAEAPAPKPVAVKKKSHAAARAADTYVPY